MKTLNALVLAATLFLTSLAAHAHTLDVTKGRIEKTEAGFDLVLQANLWAIFMEKPVSEISSDDYSQVIGPAQEQTLKDLLAAQLSFSDENEAPTSATITIDHAATELSTHETPVRFSLSVPRARIKTHSNFGTLILVTPEGQTIIAPDSQTGILPYVGSKIEVFKQYVVLGFEHILPLGVDHVLFVLTLFLLAPALRPLLFQVSAFTIAHTISLALASLGIVSLSGDIVEPLIALSICYTAIENVFVKDLKKWRVGLVFAFGLLHGLGFAGVLSELGLPKEAFIESLLGFNIGVEFGQLAVLAIAALTIGWFRKQAWYRRGIVVPLSFLIAAIGLYWTIERAFLS